MTGKQKAKPRYKARQRTIGDLVRNLIPEGTDATKLDWSLPPPWPPDLFAVVATLAEASGCYAVPGVTLSRTPRDRTRKRKEAILHKKLGESWAKNFFPSKTVMDIWEDIYLSFARPITKPAGRTQRWHRAVVRLIAIADEACKGVGFFPGVHKHSDLAIVVFQEIAGPALNLPHLPFSLCILVSPESACVQPKTLVPNVGCTLRSLSHNLALLPGIGTVKTRWSMGFDKEKSNKSLNLLLIPFPYNLAGSEFLADQPPADYGPGYFRIKQDWLKHQGKAISPSDFVDFLLILLDEAKSESPDLHGIVLPETALTTSFADRVADDLKLRAPKGFELFITGTTFQVPGGQFRNIASIYRFYDASQIETKSSQNERLLDVVRQSKHHRWALDSNQVKRYHLGHMLTPESRWWENIDVSEREVHFTLVRHNACLAALVCEDLARFDPVLPAINAVGPTLVCALLMDGPQLTTRWPNRYATVLADDPGSSVLTLTSLGMVARSGLPGEHVPRAIALWREAGGATKELHLPRGDHALLLTMSSQRTSQTTMDHRLDGDIKRTFTLSGVRSIRHPTPPAWAREFSEPGNREDIPDVPF